MLSDYMKHDALLTFTLLFYTSYHKRFAYLYQLVQRKPVLNAFTWTSHLSCKLPTIL